MPSEYLELPPIYLPNIVNITEYDSFEHAVVTPELQAIVSEEELWLKKSEKASWAKFHAERQRKDGDETNAHLSALLPIWRDNAKSPAMIRHAMSIIKKTVEYLNSGLTPVITFDQPLYELAKKIQWHFPEQFGSSQFVVMMGPLHIEMALMGAIGTWLDDSGWTIALFNAQVSTPGNEKLVTGHEVAQTKYAHQVTAKALYHLL